MQPKELSLSSVWRWAEISRPGCEEGRTFLHLQMGPEWGRVSSAAASCPKLVLGDRGPAPDEGIRSFILIFSPSLPARSTPRMWITA